MYFLHQNMKFARADSHCPGTHLHGDPRAALFPFCPQAAQYPAPSLHIILYPFCILTDWPHFPPYISSKDSGVLRYGAMWARFAPLPDNLSQQALPPFHVKVAPGTEPEENKDYNKTSEVGKDESQHFSIPCHPKPLLKYFFSFVTFAHQDSVISICNWDGTFWKDTANSQAQAHEKIWHPDTKLTALQQLTGTTLCPFPQNAAFVSSSGRTQEIYMFQPKPGDPRLCPVFLSENLFTIQPMAQ